MSSESDNQATLPKGVKHHLRRLESVSLKHIHRFLVRRWKNLQEARRNVFGWLLLVFALSALTVFQSIQATNHIMVEGPGTGGIFTSGVIGSIDNLNPIFAGTQAELSAAKLLFSSLIQYDDKGDVVGDLAQSWSVDDQGKVYTIQMRHDARWSDGAPVTADDVVYTFDAIQDANTRSPLYSSWNTISVQKVDDYTIRFTLPSPYAPFINSLTVGILPQHVLNGLPMAALRSSDYNRSPSVTSGPFTFKDMRALDQQNSHYLIDMIANKAYYMGAPKVDGFQLYTYADQDQLEKAFRSQEVATVTGLDAQHLADFNGSDNIVTESPLYDGVYAFLNMDSPILADANVRNALQLSVDRAKLVQQIGGDVQPVTGPLLPGQLGYNAALAQPGFNFDAAMAALDKDGWTLNGNGQRVKNGQVLHLRLLTSSAGDYPDVARALIDDWSRLGITFDNTQPVRPEDIQQSIQPRFYDILIYDISLGKDPDEYAYWHSSQVGGNGFNLSQYRSTRVDDELASARATSNTELRSAKYQAFTSQWLADVPAIGLYRPTLSLLQTKSVTSYGPRPLVYPSDRFFDVIYWSTFKQQEYPTL